MNIKIVEEQTGISKQNIRFYEKHDLVKPSRNSENEYRDYSEEDIRILKIIKILRKLDLPIEEIRKVLEDKVSLSDAMKQHQEKLQKEEKQLQAAIAFCKTLENNSLDKLDADLCLQEMKEKEEGGSVYMSIVNDIIKIDKEEKRRSFSFSPDVPISNKEEFTQELLKYASENDLNIIITKESMYPEFEINDVEYEAHRMVTRFGAIVECTVKNGVETKGKQVSPEKNKVLHFFVRTWPIFLLAAILLFTRIVGNTSKENVVAVLADTLVTCIVAGCFLRFMPKG